MSALASYMLKSKLVVGGYDRNQSAITKRLEEEGATLHFKDDPNLLTNFLEDSTQDSVLVVYTPAISSENRLLSFCLEKGYLLMKRAEALAKVTEGKRVVAVAGTHGKTTTSAYVAHILHESGVPFKAFLGGIASGYESNYLEYGEDADWIVIEADEFDRSFHKLQPDISVITSVDADHLDIYGNEQELVEAFQEFADLTKKDGRLILGPSASEKLSPPQHVRCDHYGNSSENSLQDVHASDGKFSFRLWQGTQEIGSFLNGIPGYHNCENAVAALLATRDLVTIDRAKQAIASMRGVKRRFEKIYENGGLVYIDDYAHHPVEIARMLESARELYPDQELTVVFQPHLYSRTRDFAEDFAQSLSKADSCYLLPIYPAREEPIDDISSATIADQMSGAQLISRNDVLDVLKQLKEGVLLSLGAGDIDRLVPQIQSLFQAHSKMGINE